MKHCCVGIEHSVVMEDGKGVEEFAGIVKSPRSQSEWLARNHETLEINRQNLGLSPKKPDMPPRSLNPSQPSQCAFS